ncbi:hypothetical protein LXL04_000493 [Taraxacum kok-saghyz]
MHMGMWIPIVNLTLSWYRCEPYAPEHPGPGFEDPGFSYYIRERERSRPSFPFVFTWQLQESIREPIEHHCETQREIRVGRGDEHTWTEPASEAEGRTAEYGRCDHRRSKDLRESALQSISNHPPVSSHPSLCSSFAVSVSFPDVGPVGCEGWDRRQPWQLGLPAAPTSFSLLPHRNCLLPTHCSHFRPQTVGMNRQETFNRQKRTSQSTEEDLNNLGGQKRKHKIGQEARNRPQKTFRRGPSIDLRIGPPNRLSNRTRIGNGRPSIAPE